MMETSYLNGGYFKSEEEWIHPRRRIDSNEIIFVTKGNVYLKEEEKDYLLRPGDLLILEKDKLHFGTELSRGVEFYWLHFLGEAKVKLFFLPDMAAMTLLFRQLLHYENTPSYPKRALELAFELIQLELRVQSESTEGASRFLTEIKEWIRIHSDQPITVREISQRFGYHSDYICRLFQKHYHISLKGYIEEQRLNYIKRLLLTTDDTISEIARSSGFDSYQNFLKFFTYHEDMSPSEFRNTFTNTHRNNH